jgi:hypothetical protein
MTENILVHLFANLERHISNLDRCRAFCDWYSVDFLAVSSVTCLSWYLNGRRRSYRGSIIIKRRYIETGRSQFVPIVFSILFQLIDVGHRASMVTLGAGRESKSLHRS